MSLEQLECRAGEVTIKAEGRFLTGYAAVFNQRARIGDFDEEIRPGAFLESITGRSGRAVFAFLDHDPKQFLGRQNFKDSLGLAEDARGLSFALQLPDTTLARDVHALAKAGLLGGASIGFIAKEERWEGRVRVLSKVDLREISLVTLEPAYSGTSVQARSRNGGERTLLQRRIDLLKLGAAQ